MLSRVAERVYWAGRYLERTEAMARLVRVYGGLLLDLPKETGIGWAQLVDIAGDVETFAARFSKGSDRSYLRFLLTDDQNPGSLIASLAQARENFRTTRDLLPSDSWRSINELNLYAREHLSGAVSQRKRDEVLATIVDGCQQIEGALAGTMSHGDAYQFLCIGRSLERADMSTRVIDVATATLMAGRPEISRYDNTLWMTVLRSLSAYQMYRQYVRRRIVGQDVIEFLLTDMHFPRAVQHCLNQIDASLRVLPHYEPPLRSVLRLHRIVAEQQASRADVAELHHFIDTLQADLGALHGQIAANWFLPVAA